VNTSVERFLEAATLVVPLFLITRVCALAAPALGRTVSRWMLAAGIPAILVCALAGAAVLDRWPAEVEAVLATGLLVALLLCLVWIPALLVKAGRWAFRRGRAAPTATGPPRIAESFRLAGALTAVVVAGVPLRTQVRYGVSAWALKLRPAAKAPLVSSMLTASVARA